LDDLFSIIEAILFAAGEPVRIARIADILGVDAQAVEDAARAMTGRFNFERRGVTIVVLEEKLQMVTRREFGVYVRKALEYRKAAALSPAALEVLAIIAYRQPVTRLMVEKIRGVDSAYTVSSLEDKGLIEQCGRLNDVPGRPVQFRTTPLFLRTFGLTSIGELPDIESVLAGQLSFEDLVKATDEDRTGEEPISIKELLE